MPPHASADAFVVFTRKLLRHGVTVHHGHTPEIEITGPDTACGIWATNDILRFQRLTLRGYGHYRGEYRKMDGAWRIARLHLTRLIVDRDLS